MGCELPRIRNLSFNEGVSFNFALKCSCLKETPNCFAYCNRSPRYVRIVIAEDDSASFSRSNPQSNRVNVILSMLRMCLCWCCLE